MGPKRDIVASRTPEDTERKYGKRIIDNEKEAKSQSADLASLKLSIKDINQGIGSLEDKILKLNDLVEDINKEIESINESISNLSDEVELNTQKRHSHENKDLLDSITQQNIDKWNISYKELAMDITVGQTVLNIANYNLVLATINNINIPCYRNEDTFSGFLNQELVSIQFNEETVIQVSHVITKLIGIF